jgi:hypothetical protein
MEENNQGLEVEKAPKGFLFVCGSLLWLLFGSQKTGNILCEDGLWCFVSTIP